MTNTHHETLRGANAAPHTPDASAPALDSSSANAEACDSTLTLLSVIDGDGAAVVEAEKQALEDEVGDGLVLGATRRAVRDRAYWEEKELAKGRVKPMTYFKPASKREGVVPSHAITIINEALKHSMMTQAARQTIWRKTNTVVAAFLEGEQKHFASLGPVDPEMLIVALMEHAEVHWKGCGTARYGHRKPTQITERDLGTAYLLVKNDPKQMQTQRALDAVRMYRKAVETGMKGQVG